MTKSPRHTLRSPELSFPVDLVSDRMPTFNIIIVSLPKLKKKKKKKKKAMSNSLSSLLAASSVNQCLFHVWSTQLMSGKNVNRN